MVLKRLFVGNLPENLTGDELSSKFSSFGNVQDVEVKTKNETTFGFVSLFVEEDKNLKHCIDVLNNTKWRGNLIKVQLAKESFMDRLKREQAENKEKASRPVGIISFEDEDEPENSTRNMGSLMTNYYKDVAQGKVKSLLPHLAAEKRKEEDEKVPVGVAATEKSVIQSKLLSLASTTHHNKYSTPTNTSSPSLLKNGGRDSIPKTKNVMLDTKSKKSSRKVQDSSDEDDSDMEEAGHGLPPFRGLLAYPELNAPVVVEKKSEPVLKISSPVAQPIEKRLLQVVESSKLPIKTPLNFKKRNSDQIRQKSMEDRLNLNKNRSAMIKNSLLHTMEPSVSQSSSSTAEVKKKKKRDNLSQNLFDNNDDTAEDVESSFKVKPQFEGKSGQTNFELSSKFAAYDNRFVIDERFRDEEDEKDKGDDSKANLEQEKLASFSILSDILGTSVTPNLNNKKTKSPKKSSVIIQRYDPENDDGEAEASTEVEVSELPISKEKTKPKEKTTTTVEGEVVEEPPKVATYRVASNLTELFSSTANSTGFSLLQAFGSQNGQSSNYLKDDDEQTTTPTKTIKENSFWQKKNPFKYDSSESENEDEKTITTTKTPKKASNGHDAGPPKKLPKKERFFFSKRDSRFEGVEDFFLKSTEDMKDVLYRFNNGERSELKLICKGKVKNTKRKSDKRMETLKRLKRKMKEKNKKKITLEGSNAVPIGSSN